MTVDRTRFAAPQRFLHWLMAACIFAMLFIGIGMISVVTPKYLDLIRLHKPLGIAILVLALIRLGLRVKYGAPSLPPDLPFLVKFAAESSQWLFYALMIALPLIGWAMLSASSHPVILFGSMHLPPIAPVDENLYTILRQAHHWLALLFFLLILMHFGAMLFHKLIRNDGIFETMAPVGGDDRFDG
jgi:cytochrome b561